MDVQHKPPPWLQILSEMGQALRQFSSLQRSLSTVADRVKQAIPCDGSSVRLLDERREFFHAIARSGKSVHQPTMMALPKGKGVIGWVADNAEPLLINDTRSDSRFVVNSQQTYPVLSIICAPMIVAGRVLGVLGVTDSRSNAFSDFHRDALVIFADAAAPWIELARLREISAIDPLTRVFNRRYMERRLTEELSRSERKGTALSVMLVDLDRFKAVNDRYGHIVGDAFLQTVAARLAHGLRAHDVVCRYGGDEFVVIMPETTLLEARPAAARMMRLISDNMIDLDEEYGVQLSASATAGLSEFAAGDTIKTILGRADSELLVAKAVRHEALSVQAQR